MEIGLYARRRRSRLKLGRRRCGGEGMEMRPGRVQRHDVADAAGLEVARRVRHAAGDVRQAGGAAEGGGELSDAPLTARGVADVLVELVERRLDVGRRPAQEVQVVLVEVAALLADEDEVVRSAAEREEQHQADRRRAQPAVVVAPDGCDGFLRRGPGLRIALLHACLPALGRHRIGGASISQRLSQSNTAGRAFARALPRPGRPQGLHYPVVRDVRTQHKYNRTRTDPQYEDADRRLERHGTGRQCAASAPEPQAGWRRQLSRLTQRS